MEKIKKIIDKEVLKEENLKYDVREGQIKREDFDKSISQISDLIQNRQMPLTKESKIILRKIKTIIDKSPDDVTNKDIHLLREMLTQLVVTFQFAVGSQTIPGQGNAKASIENQNQW